MQQNECSGKVKQHAQVHDLRVEVYLDDSHAHIMDIVISLLPTEQWTSGVKTESDSVDGMVVCFRPRDHIFDGCGAVGGEETVDVVGVGSRFWQDLQVIALDIHIADDGQLSMCREFLGEPYERSIGSGESSPEPFGQIRYLMRPPLCEDIESGLFQQQPEIGIEVVAHRKIQHARVSEISLSMPRADQSLTGKLGDRFPDSLPAHAQGSCERRFAGEHVVTDLKRGYLLLDVLFHLLVA